jgi:hypothetical protein
MCHTARSFFEEEIVDGGAWNVRRETRERKTLDRNGGGVERET